MKYKITLQEGKEAVISAECLGDAHTQAIRQWGTSVSGVLEWNETKESATYLTTCAHSLLCADDIREFLARYHGFRKEYLGQSGSTHYILRVPPESDLYFASIESWPDEAIPPCEWRHANQPDFVDISSISYSDSQSSTIMEDTFKVSAGQEAKHMKIDVVRDCLKHDINKYRWDLLPIYPIEAIIRVLEYGADKYGAENWRGLRSQENRLYAAALRHLTAWKKGEKTDSESGLSHLAHCAANLVFMLEFEKDER